VFRQVIAGLGEFRGELLCNCTTATAFRRAEMKICACNRPAWPVVQLLFQPIDLEAIYLGGSFGRENLQMVFDELSVTALIISVTHLGFLPLNEIAMTFELAMALSSLSCSFSITASRGDWGLLRPTSSNQERIASMIN
jgi:hypothetical protein